MSKLFCDEDIKSFVGLFGWLSCARTHVHMRHENVSGSFETQSCCRNVRTCHELACVCKVVTRSLTRFLLVYDTCRHMRTKRHAVIWNCVRTQETKRDLRSKALFRTRRTTSAASVSRMSKHIAGLGVHATWKSVLLSPNRGCENTFCCSTLGLLVVLHVLLPLLPSFTQHFGSEERVWKMKCESFFFSISYELSKEKQVKLLKIDFRKNVKRTHFSGVRPACTSVVSLFAAE